MKKLFLRYIKQTDSVKKSGKKAVKEEVAVESNDVLGFDDSDYKDDNVDDKKINLPDNLKRYSISYDNLVSHKEARTSIEDKLPFIVSKRGKKLDKVENEDTLYKLCPKMRISDKYNVRVGFLLADNKLKYIKSKDINNKKYIGVLNDEYLIEKKKRFNYKKVGYLKLKDTTGKENLYVEVITSKGYKWLFTLIVIISLLSLVYTHIDKSNWHIDDRLMKLYKTNESIEYQESALSIEFNPVPVLNDGILNINLCSEYIEDTTLKFKLFDSENNIIYESEEIDTGEQVDNISLKNSLPVGTYKCTLVCDAYKNKKYLSSLNSELEIQVK